MKLVFSLLFLSVLSLLTVSAGDITIKINKKYLNLPVSRSEKRAKMSFLVKGKPERAFVIRLAPEKPDYWVFSDVSLLKGKSLTISYEGNSAGLSKIYQDDVIAGSDSLYRETNRPRFHFTSRRGWNNDPNGLVFFEGEYHLFYQHNPYETEWENMHWGHAVSTDLMHWTELPDALYPDHLGTMFSGSAVIDFNNSAGFQTGTSPAMVAIYTADRPDRETQCIAYSNDRGRSWTKYEKNPVIDSKEKWNSRDTRDPKVFWYEPTRNWVMVLYEKDGNSIYTSTNLKEWNFSSHLAGFFECPEFFELPVDGKKGNTRWVMLGASGAYRTGTFDGKVFAPEPGVFQYTSGSIYAAQTYTNIPETDGRRIQIGWGRISHPGMPFNQMMLLPTELTLHTTPAGIRLFSYPVSEVESLRGMKHQWSGLTVEKANENLKPLSGEDCLHLKATVKPEGGTSSGLYFSGQEIFNIDQNISQINSSIYATESISNSTRVVDVYIDKTSIEVFVDEGRYSYSFSRNATGSKKGFEFRGNAMQIIDLQVYPMKSIFTNK
jgi:sucrose-6-phosphate hydrolase SacC (GH32 family)